MRTRGLLGLAIAAPAAYSMAFFKSPRTRDILMWMLSTKMMPAVGALVPVYVMAQKTHLLDSTLGLTLVFTLAQGVYLSKHMTPAPATAGDSGGTQ